jgi:putative ABC transport system substrate-binding protein
MRRRLLLLAGSATWLLPRVGLSQPARHSRIGYLSGGSLTYQAAWLDAFKQGLRDLGYNDSSILMETRFAEGHFERLPGLVAELVRLAPEVIVTGGSPAAQAAKSATATIPIVMATSGDPVRAGLVASLARPGGNVTGLSNIQDDIAEKQLDLLKALLSHAQRVAVLINPGTPAHANVWQMILRAAPVLHLDVVPVQVRSPEEIENAFSSVTEAHVDAILVLADAVFLIEARRIAELAATKKLPAIYSDRNHVRAGGLMSYAPDARDSFRRAATYVDKILKGTRPDELPVEQPTKLELVINLKAAQALALEVPVSLLVRADEIIE